MHLLIISGFLGSGKTTILLQLAQRLIADGHQIAIVENEVGEVGVDDTIVRETGLEVKEIFSGCVCCSLRIDLINTLLEIEREVKPSIVVIEPSGVAGPKQLLQAIEGYGGEIESRRILSVVDAVRFAKIQNLDIPLIRDGIEIANVAALNKVDAAGPDAVVETIGKIRSIRDDVDIVEVVAVNGLNMDVLYDRLFSNSMTVPNEKGEENDAPSGPRPTAYATSFEVAFQSSQWLVDQLTKCLCEIETELRSAGCDLIGHIKVAVRSKRGGYLTGSVTDFNEEPAFKGKLSAKDARGKLSLNVIVYGVKKKLIASIAEKAIEVLKSEG